jgi:hypothetical protein
VAAVVVMTTQGSRVVYAQIWSWMADLIACIHEAGAAARLDRDPARRRDEARAFYGKLLGLDERAVPPKLNRKS